MRLKFRIGRLMDEKDVKEGKLSDLTGLSRNTIRALRRNASTRVDLGTLEKIAAALGVRPSELLEDVEGTPGQRKPARLASALT